MLFRERIAESAGSSGPIILAADMPYTGKVVQDVTSMIDRMSGCVCALKMNFQLLLPLGIGQIKDITYAAHAKNMQCIADIKLNDIGNTNLATTSILWEAGFDAVIANPIMGPEALSELVCGAHTKNNGVISLCHMSSPEGAVSYEMPADGHPLYEKFLGWGLSAGVDGIIVGATFPDIIRDCKQRVKDDTDIFSPGIGAQGGSAKMSFANGTNYAIIGRTLLNSDNPAETAKSILS